MINFPILIKLNYCVYKSRYLNPNHNEDLRDDFQYKLKFAKLNKLTQIYKNHGNFPINNNIQTKPKT